VTKSPWNESDSILGRLCASYLRGPDFLDQALNQLREELTFELADKASQNSVKAIQEGDANKALALSTISSRVFNLLGRREEAFTALTNFFNILFMLAQTEKAYADIYLPLTEILASNPYGQGEPSTGLRAWVLAADCAFFACEAAADDARKKHWLEAALTSLMEAARFLNASDAAAFHPQYASIAVAVYRRCLSKDWLGEPWAAANLAKVTRALDQAVPGKLSYTEPGKDENIHEGRAVMSETFNNGAYGGGPPPGSPVLGLLGRKRR